MSLSAESAASSTTNREKATRSPGAPGLGAEETESGDERNHHQKSLAGPEPEDGVQRRHSLLLGKGDVQFDNLELMRENAARIEEAASLLREASSVLFITGAGISADSGLPTYRGIGGLYEEADTPEGIPIEEALSGEMMRINPALTWKYIHQIEASARGASFNRAHAILVEAERRFERAWVLTQNVDGLHRRAGSTNVIDIHGDVHDLLCTECEHRATVEDYRNLAPLPLCPSCGAPLRPEVVLFGELLPLKKVETLERELLRGFDVVFSIGTTSVFPYIARPVVEARMRRKATIEINPGETMISEEVDVKLAMRAAEACEALWARL